MNYDDFLNQLTWPVLQSRNFWMGWKMQLRSQDCNP